MQQVYINIFVICMGQKVLNNITITAFKQETGFQEKRSQTCTVLPKNEMDAQIRPKHKV